MECNFVVGQKVVCIETSVDMGLIEPCEKYKNDLTGLTKGNIYTIRDVVSWCNPWGRYIIGVRLVEIVRPIQKAWAELGEAPYYYQRFRPLQTSDMEWFKHLVENPSLKIADTNEFTPKKVSKNVHA